MSESNIKNFYGFLQDEEYDTDALIYDVEDVQNDQSNISNAAPAFVPPLRQYIAESTLMTSGFNVGLIFYYWDDYSPSQIKPNTDYWFNINDHGGYDIAELYIDKPKWKNLKQEILNSGFCS
eukprot:277914_1